MPHWLRRQGLKDRAKQMIGIARRLTAERRLTKCGQCRLRSAYHIRETRKAMFANGARHAFIHCGDFHGNSINRSFSLVLARRRGLGISSLAVLKLSATTRQKGRQMNWDEIEGRWKRLTGSAQERWAKLSDDDWQIIAGKKDQLVGRIQERYGITNAEAEKQADEWCRALRRSPSDSNLATRL